MRSAFVVFGKEVRENVRDKRTMMSALVMGPFLGPVIMMTIISVMVNKQIAKADEPLDVPVVGAQYAPNLVHALESMGASIKPPVADPEATVKARDADVILRIGKKYGESLRKGEPAQVELVYDSSQQDANGSVKRLKTMLQQYAQEQGAMRQVARGLSPTVSMPLVISERDQSTAQSRSVLVFGMLPYFFIFAAFIGGMYLAIDTTAGERERQSLEPLFANPVPRWQLLAGKLGATSAFAFTSLVLTIIAFAVAGRMLPMDKMEMALNLGPSFAFVVLLAMIPLVVLLSALQTLVAAFAKSYREAQTYLSVLMMVPIVPTLILSISPVKPQLWMYAIPLVGQQVTMMQLLRGETVTAAAVGLCIAVSAAVALLVCAGTAWVYRSERLAISG
jgi:sodium transport system permease protein